MKKNTLLAIGAIAVVGYFIYKNSSGYGGYSGQGSLPSGGGYGSPTGSQGRPVNGLGLRPGNRQPPMR